LTDIGGTVKLLILFTICGAIVFVFWLTVEKGVTIAELGRPESAGEVMARLPLPAEQPQSSPQVHGARTVNPPRQDSRQYAQPRLGTTYKWVDEKGTIHFSDRPMSAKSEQIEVRPIDTYEFPQAQSVYVAQVNRAPQTATEVRQQRPASRRPISAADYKFFNNTFQTGSDLILSGRISGGPECKALHLTIWAESNKGKRVCANTVVEGAGGMGSTLYRAVVRAPYDNKAAWPTWDVTSVQAYCAD